MGSCLYRGRSRQLEILECKLDEVNRHRFDLEEIMNNQGREMLELANLKQKSEDDFNEKVREVSKLENRISDLEQVLASKEQETQRLKTELTSKEKEFSEINQQIAYQQKTIENSPTHVLELNNEIQSMKLLAEELQRENQEIKAQKSITLEETEKESKELEALQAHLANVLETKDYLEKKLETRTKELEGSYQLQNQLENKIIASNNFKDIQKLELDTLIRNHKEEQKCDAELIQQLQNEKLSLTERLGRLELNQKHKLNAIKEALKGNYRQITTLKEDYSSLKQSYEDVNTELLAIVQSQQVSLAQKAAEVSLEVHNLEQLLHTKKEEIAQNEITIKAFQETKSQLEHSNKRQTTKLAELSALIQQYEEEQSINLESINSLNTQVSSQLQELSVLQSQNDHLSRHTTQLMHSLTHSLATFKGEFHSVQSLFSSSTSEFQKSLLQFSASLTQKLNECSVTIQALQKQQDSLHTKFLCTDHSYVATKSKLKSKINSLKKQCAEPPNIKQLKQDNQRLETNYTKSLLIIKELTQRLADSEREKALDSSGKDAYRDSVIEDLSQQLNILIAANEELQLQAPPAKLTEFFARLA